MRSSTAPWLSEGTVRWVTSRGCVFFRGEGEDRHATRFIGTVMDVTERKQAEEELREAKEAAEAANRAKDQFLATLSHELRTPLTPVLPWSPAWRGTAACATSADRLAMIRRNVELEARLIDDLLDLTRIARGKLELQRAGRRRPRPWSSTPSRSAAPELRCRPARSVVTELAASEHRVWGDRLAPAADLLEPAANAVKFTPEGGTIVVRTWNEAGQSWSWRSRDTGMGIEPGSLPQIFDAFEQGGRRSPAFGGLGLGLAISKAVAELHGGRITALSPGYGLGATFRVELPAGGLARRGRARSAPRRRSRRPAVRCGCSWSKTTPTPPRPWPSCCAPWGTRSGSR